MKKMVGGILVALVVGWMASTVDAEGNGGASDPTREVQVEGVPESTNDEPRGQVMQNQGEIEAEAGVPQLASPTVDCEGDLKTIGGEALFVAEFVADDPSEALQKDVKISVRNPCNPLYCNDLYGQPCPGEGIRDICREGPGWPCNVTCFCESGYWVCP